jgi:hypothetical protein
MYFRDRMSTKTLNILTLFMAIMVLSAHVLPMSFYLLDAEVVAQVNVNFTELEEEKKVEKLGHELTPAVYVTLCSINLYLTYFLAIPISPYMEVASPPPDLA